MCTAITVGGTSAIFGRTLDLERSLGEVLVLAQRAAPIPGLAATDHPAILGTAILSGGAPLFFDAMSEHGLAAAALNFPCSAAYLADRAGKTNIPSYAFIPFILANAKSLAEAKHLAATLNVTPDSFAPDLPATPMHWMISDGREAIVVEPRECGLVVYDSPCGVLTNEPPYDYQLRRLADFRALTPADPESRLLSPPPRIDSGGLGALGLPGDPSSTSRLVRAAYARAYTSSDGSEWGEVSRFFHIAETVAVPDGCSRDRSGNPTRTVYTCCYDLTHFAYYVRTYASHRLHSLAPVELDLSGGQTLAIPFPEGGCADPLPKPWHKIGA